jgi:hypothetical protein
MKLSNSPMISVENQDLYQCEFQDDFNTCEFRFKIPKHINPNYLKIKIENGVNLAVYIENIFPYFLCINLISSLRKHQISFESDCLTLLLSKNISQQWRFPIVDQNLIFKAIDPQSAFLFSIQYPSHSQSSEFFNFSLNTGFIPALLYAFSVLNDINNYQKKIYFLQLAADIYQSKEDILLYAIELVSHIELKFC